MSDADKLQAAEARIVRLEIERNEWRRLFNDQPEFLTAVDCRLLAENERDALRAQLAAMEKERDEWCGIATDWKERLAAAAEEAARLRRALDDAGRQISGAALHQMHEHAESEVRGALHKMSDALSSPSTGAAVTELAKAAERLIPLVRRGMAPAGRLSEEEIARDELKAALARLREAGLA